MPTLKSASNSQVPDKSLSSPAMQFRIASISEGKCNLTSYNRRDFFKVTLITGGHTRLLYANKEFIIDRPALIFTSPIVPFSWDSVCGQEGSAGYFCVFTDSFILAPGSRERLQDSALFRAGGNPVFMLDDTQVAYAESLFKRMSEEIDGDYRYKSDIISSHMNLLLHEAMKMQPLEALSTPFNAPERITKFFLGLLEKQFPIDFPDDVLQLKKASDFAALINVHANHLNAAVQEITGKSTTSHINERIIFEAKSLIRHTDLSIAEIAFSLGFDYVSYFNRFFKKHSGLTPVAFRKIN